MVDRNLAIRLAVIDGGKVKAELRDVGDSGAAPCSGSRRHRVQRRARSTRWTVSPADCGAAWRRWRDEPALSAPA
ncbi:MAG: hypothetical protein HWD60_00075 [Defluviicoccus sp.]|nr:MAG: hypothetical protein HWD60_00075 [Defluviicoccus sp.]